jgi:uncharacterized protein (TIGR04255 family)
MIPASYFRDPIVEAAAEVWFTPGRAWSSAVADEVVEALRTEYPGSARPRGQIQIAVGPTGSPAAPFVQQGVFLPSSDEKALVGVGENQLSIHVHAPYPGWSTFRPRIERAFATFCRIATPREMTRLAVRYIDQIRLPLAHDEGITDYFPCMPMRPTSMPTALDGFHVVTQASDSAEQFTAILRVASMPAPMPDGELHVLYDLNLFRPFDPPQAAEVRTALEHLDFLHKRQRQIFEDSITERTRRLFQ